MSRELLIKLAEESGLLIPEPQSSCDYNHPAHQRFISRLMKFANKVERATEENVAERFDDAGIKKIILGGK